MRKTVISFNLFHEIVIVFTVLGCYFFKFFLQQNQLLIVLFRRSWMFCNRVFSSYIVELEVL